MANWSIVEAQYRIVGGVGGHNLLVLKDPTGKVVAELDGLAFGADGLPKPIGILPTDQLKVKLSNGAYLYDNDQPQVEIASGDQTSIMNLWAAATASGDQINSLNLRYPPMGFIPPNSPSGSVLNSNSVASTLIRAMGLVEPSIPGSAFLTAGRGNILLDQNAINDIQSQHNIQSGPSDSPGSAVPPGAVPLPRPRPGAAPSSAPNSPGPLNILPDLPDDAPPAGPVPPRPNPGALPPFHLLRFNRGEGGLGDAVVPGQLPPAVPGALLDDGYPDDWHVPPSAQGDGFPDDWYVPASAMAPGVAPPARSAQQSLADPTGSYQRPAQGRFANLSDAEINNAFTEYYRLKSGVDAPSVRDTLGLYPMPWPLGDLPGARPQPAGGSLFSTLFGGAPRLSAASLFGGDASPTPSRFASAQPASASQLGAANWGSSPAPPDPTAVPFFLPPTIGLSPMYAGLFGFPPLSISSLFGGPASPSPAWPSFEPESEDDDEED